MADKKVTTRKITQDEAASCAAEQIHLISSIQAHGFLLVLEPKSRAIVQYSENTHQLLALQNGGAELNSLELLGSPLSKWLTLVDPGSIEHLDSDRTIKVEIERSGIISGEFWECLGHKTGNWISLEFIPTTPESYDSFQIISQMDRMVELLRSAKGTQNLYDTITTQFQKYTQYDRVMMYRFLPDWSGEVVSEAVSERESPKFTHMRFPADDIPSQARALYKLNKVRVFADSAAEPAKLIPKLLPDGCLLDQSYSLLRNMSDMHRIYLTNMGVRATLTLSIIMDDTLWGLVVFHHNDPKTPPNHVVSQLKLSCELFTDIISSFLMPALNMHNLTQLMKVKSRIESTFNTAKMASISETLFQQSLSAIAEVTEYDYLGIVYGDWCYCLVNGELNLLKSESVEGIVNLFGESNERSYQTKNLHEEKYPITGIEDMVGIFVMRSQVPPDFYVFFGKKEVIKTIKWGGVPNTVNIVIENEQRHLEPRSSFALWRQRVKGQCDHWDDYDLKILECFFTSCKDFVSVKGNELLLDKLAKSAHFDALTNLANRSYLKEYIENIHQSNELIYISLMFIDLDNFKDVNDFMGHETGDRLLICVADRLKSCSRPNDLVVRLGGDEFVIVFAHKTKPSRGQLEQLAEKIVKSVGEPVVDQEHTIVITPSVGIIESINKDIGFNELLKRADIAMYAAKNEGKNGYHIFNKKDQEAFNQKAILTMDLRDYVSHGDIELHFQAQCDFHRKVTGIEVLARWNHQTFGYINPEFFIEIAEMNNLIIPMGLKIIEQTCYQLAQWDQKGLASQFETVSINISPSQLLDQTFEQDISAILERYNIKPERIRLEITESIFMQNYDVAIHALESLRQKGFTISLDDFGTGYSSLNYLWKLPIDEVKIDKSFVSNMAKDDGLLTMVESIIDLCKKLKLEVVAEGVESNAEFQILKGLGCDTCQGYFFHKTSDSQTFSETFCHD